jgi:hypothetical protein
VQKLMRRTIAISVRTYDSVGTPDLAISVCLSDFPAQDLGKVGVAVPVMVMACLEDSANLADNDRF